MREPVPDIVAQEFLLHFLKSFSSGKSLYISVREARERLEGLENDFPCASWLPVIFQNLGESLLTWQELCPMSLGTQQQAQNEDCNLYTKRVEPWNKCRENNPELVPDFKEINLSGVNLAGANLSRVNLSRVHVGYQANYNIKAHPFLRIRDFPELGKEIIDTYQSIIHYLAIDPHQKPSPRSNIRPLQGFLSDCNALEMTFKRTGIIYTLVYQIAPQLDSTVYIISFAKSQIAIERAIERILLQEQFPHNQAINNVFFSSINNVKAGQENSISKNHQGIYKPMSEITNNNQNANIANFVNEEDNAQVTASNFSKTSGANTAELLQLITTMRQTATQFPREIQDDIIIDIDDVEEEIKKPENQRNSTRLRKRLIALATLASMITTPVAGITDFANNAIDLGNKLGIELQLPSAP
jgi:internalin A